CARMVKKFAGNTNSSTREAVAAACVLRPDALADFKPLVQTAEKTAAAAPDDLREQVLLAALLLRAGQAARAVPILEKVPAGERRPSDLWLLVLAYHRAGQKDKLKEALAK